MNVLVTGGAGYIGSHTCKALRQRGHNPVVVDNLSRGHNYAVKWGEIYHCDIDARAIRDIIKSRDIRAVIHFAALADVGESMSNPLFYYENNVAQTIKLLRTCTEAGIERFVFSSTCAVYGSVNEDFSIAEHSQKLPINTYGRSKLMVEDILIDTCSVTGMSGIILRYFNAAGADRDGEIGEDHRPENHLIPRIIDAVIYGKEVNVFGDDYRTKDGSCVRDYVHVEDLARAHVLALEKNIIPGTIEDYNLGSGIGYSVFEVIEEVNLLMKRRGLPHKVTVKVGPRRQGDPDVLIAKTKKADKHLNWRADRSLRDIVETAWNWHTKAITELENKRSGAV